MLHFGMEIQSKRIQQSLLCVDSTEQQTWYKHILYNKGVKAQLVRNAIRELACKHHSGNQLQYYEVKTIRICNCKLYHVVL